MAGLRQYERRDAVRRLDFAVPCWRMDEGGRTMMDVFLVGFSSKIWCWRYRKRSKVRPPVEFRLSWAR